MCDIDRCVELAELRDFIAFTEGPHPCPADYEPERECCPGCGESVTHPLYPDCYADHVRLIGQPLMGWHNVCAEALEREREAVLDVLPRFSAERAEVANG